MRKKTRIAAAAFLLAFSAGALHAAHCNPNARTLCSEVGIWVEVCCTCSPYWAIDECLAQDGHWNPCTQTCVFESAVGETGCPATSQDPQSLWKLPTGGGLENDARATIDPTG